MPSSKPSNNPHADFPGENEYRPIASGPNMGGGPLKLNIPPMETMEQETCASPGECGTWKELFQSFDYDNDGYIPTNELKTAVRRSTRTFGLEVEEADYLLKDVDQNKDHLVDFSEFCFMMARAKRMRMRHVLFRAAQLVVPKNQRPSKFSYLLQYTCCPPPFVMVLATVLQVAIYFYYVLGKPKPDGYDWNYVPLNSTLIYAPVKERAAYELWRFVTYMFIHIGYSHLITNCIVQLFLGVPLELVHQWRIAVVYFISGIYGCLLMTVASPSTYVAGASGGVYGLLAAHVSDLFLNWSEMEFRWVRLFVLVVLITADTSLQVYQSLHVKVVQVAYLAHLGGALAGLALGVLVLRNLRMKTWERVAWWIALVVLVLWGAAMIALLALQYA